ncbi:hypothetical protein HDU85_004290 [Gaertneriomyces sp. JEL0708]|nr:hypothetical protein HDU85_004290 [Gaertneriomyces sp. JEL0708]
MSRTSSYDDFRRSPSLPSANLFRDETPTTYACSMPLLTDDETVRNILGSDLSDDMNNRSNSISSSNEEPSGLPPAPETIIPLTASPISSPERLEIKDDQITPDRLRRIPHHSGQGHEHARTQSQPFTPSPTEPIRSDFQEALRYAMTGSSSSPRRPVLLQPEYRSQLHNDLHTYYIQEEMRERMNRNANFQQTAYADSDNDHDFEEESPFHFAHSHDQHSTYYTEESQTLPPHPSQYTGPPVRLAAEDRNFVIIPLARKYPGMTTLYVSEEPSMQPRSSPPGHFGPRPPYLPYGSFPPQPYPPARAPHEMMFYEHMHGPGGRREFIPRGMLPSDIPQDLTASIIAHNNAITPPRHTQPRRSSPPTTLKPKRMEPVKPAITARSVTSSAATRGRDAIRAKINRKRARTPDEPEHDHSHARSNDDSDRDLSPCSQDGEREKSGDSTSSNHNLPTSPVPKKLKPSPRRSKQVHRACNNCKRAHLACDESRPCRRCTNMGRTDCADVEHKRRGRPRNSDLRNRERAGEQEKRMGGKEKVLGLPHELVFMGQAEAEAAMAAERDARALLGWGRQLV